MAVQKHNTYYDNELYYYDENGVRKPLQVGKVYSAGSGIKIENDIISVSGKYVSYADPSLDGKTLVLKDNKWEELILPPSSDWLPTIKEASANAVSTVEGKFGLDEYNQITSYNNTPFANDKYHAGYGLDLDSSTNTFSAKKGLFALSADVYNQDEIDGMIETLEQKLSKLGFYVCNPNEIDNDGVPNATVLDSEGKLSTSKVYLVKVTTAPTPDQYKEWIWDGSVWTCIGDTTMNLSGYATEDWVKNHFLSANALDLITRTSGNWDSVYTTVNTTSGDWNDVSSKLNTNDFNAWSANADIDQYTGVDPIVVKDHKIYLSANYLSANALEDISAASANWNSVYETVKATSSDWNEVYSKADKSDLDDLSGKVETLSSELETTSGKLETLSGTVETLNGKVETLSGEMKTTSAYLNEKIETLSSEFETTSAYLDEKIETLSGELESTSAYLNGNIESLSGELKTTSAYLDEKIESLSGEMETTSAYLDEKIESLSSELESTSSFLSGAIDVVSAEFEKVVYTSATENWDVTPYSAGQNIDITNHTISSKDWLPEIKEASANAVDVVKSKFNETQNGEFSGYDDTPFYVKQNTISGTSPILVTKQGDEYNIAFEQEYKRFIEEVSAKLYTSALPTVSSLTPDYLNVDLVENQDGTSAWLLSAAEQKNYKAGKYIDIDEDDYINVSGLHNVTLSSTNESIGITATTGENGDVNFNLSANIPTIPGISGINGLSGYYNSDTNDYIIGGCVYVGDNEYIQYKYGTSNTFTVTEKVKDVVDNFTDKVAIQIDAQTYNKEYIDTNLSAKQDVLVFAGNGNKIETINGSAFKVNGYVLTTAYQIDKNNYNNKIDYLSASVSSKQDKLTFEYDEDNKISAINGSALAETTYTPGQYINIDSNNEISVSGLVAINEYSTYSGDWNDVSNSYKTNSGSFLTSEDLTSYSTIEHADNASAYAFNQASALIPDVSNFITKDVNNLTNYYPKTQTSSDSELAYAFSSILKYDVTAAAGIEITTATDAGVKTFGISISAEPVVTDTRLSGYSGVAAEPDGDVSSLWNVGLTQDMLNTINGKLDSSVAAQTYQTKGDYATNTDLQIVSAGVDYVSGNLPDISDMATQTWVSSQGYLSAIPSEYVTDSELQTTLDDYATIANLESTSAEITAMIPTDLFTQASADTLYQPIGDYYSATNPSGFIDGLVILDYDVSTWQDFLDAYRKNKVILCRVKSGNTGYRHGFVAWIDGTPDNPTQVQFQYYINVNPHTSSQQTDELYIYTLLQNSTWSTSKRNTGTKLIAGNGLSSTFVSSPCEITLSVTGDYVTSSNLVANEQYTLTTSGWSAVTIPDTLSAGSGVEIVSNGINALLGTDLAFNSTTSAIQINTDGSAYGTHAFVEGTNTTASGNGAHAEGTDAGAYGQGSHAGGYGTHTTGVGNFIHGTFLNFASPDGTSVSNTPVFVGGTLNATSAQDYTDHGGYLQIMGNGTYVGAGQGNNSDAYILYRDGTVSAKQFQNADGTETINGTTYNFSGVDNIEILPLAATANTANFPNDNVLRFILES